MKSQWMSLRVVAGAVVVLAAGAVATAQAPIAYEGFNTTQDPPFVAGELNGQGGSSDGWTGPWVCSTTLADRFLVVNGGSPISALCAFNSPGDPDQHLRMFGAASSSYYTWRPMEPWASDFILEFDARYTLTAGLAATQQIIFDNRSDSTTGRRALHIKWEANGLFRINEQNMLFYNGATPGLLSMVGNWVTVRIVCDWETQRFDLYWTNNTDGCLSFVGTRVGFRDADFSGTVQKMRIDAPRVNAATDGLELDRITLKVPPPAGPCDTAVLLAVGAERFTVIAGQSPGALVYTLHNGGSVGHAYSVDVLEAVQPAVPGLFSTGVDGSGVPLGDQAADPHYTLVVNADSAGDGTYTARDDGFPIPPWIANSARSRWITVRPDHDDALGAPGNYVYRTMFSPPGTARTLYGLLAVDDELSDVLVNGRSTGIRNTSLFHTWTMFQLDLGATDDTLDFHVTNGGAESNPTGLRVEFFELAPLAQSWLVVTPANPIQVAGQTSAAVSAALNLAGLSPGIHSVYLRFKNLDDCDPPNGSFEAPVVRRIEMTLTNWEVTPDFARQDVPVMAQCPGRTPEDVEFTVSNLGSSGDLTYTVTTMNSCSWLTLDKAGPVVVGPGGSDVVTCSLDPAGLAPGTYLCSLVFTNVGTSLPEQVRTVELHVQGTIWEYKGDVNPEAPDSAGPGLSFIIHNETPMPVSQGQVEDDPQATDGKVWRLADSATAKTKFRSQPNTWVSGQLGATLVARVRVHSYGPDLSQGMALGIWDDITGNTAEIFYSGDEGEGAGTLKELRRNQSVGVVGDDAFHIIRLTVKGTSTLDRMIHVYFDEQTNPALSIPYASSNLTGVDGFVFGAGSTPGQIDIAFDWITATDVGAFAPGEEFECLGRSLVLDTCPMPFADADGDGDVDMDDFAALQRCISLGGVGYDAENCRCFDRGHDRDVDEQDVRAFEACATGAGILWSQELTPFCQP